LRTVTEPLRIKGYKKLAGLVLASTKLSPTILFFPLDEPKGCTALQDHNKQDKISNTNKNCLREVCIQKD
jgi:hypothetical protein